MDRDTVISGAGLVGTVDKTIIGEDVNGWDINVTASSTGPLFQATGVIGSTINWVVSARIVQVTG
jgi:hypothetical protein